MQNLYFKILELFSDFFDKAIESFKALDLWICIFLCILYFILDALYSNYIMAINNLKAVSTSNYSSLLIVLTGLATFEYVHNLWYLVPMAAGAWVGSYISIKREIKKKQKIKKR